MRKATVLIRASSLLEMKTRWDVVWCGLMGQGAVITLVAIVLEEPTLTERLLVRIVKKRTAMART